MTKVGKADDHSNPDLRDPKTGTQHGVPAGAAEEDSKGVPDSGRHQSETAPIADLTPGESQAKHG